ncbi:monosaccharide ABC transporter membrane protein (CUT2 family) [Arthrobacter sp. SLBN-100]|uniref:ABC transporter permease n=1 Tax=Arthrobacter sp. SLBN-100 TaxID=2768450 RepID=UPI00114E79C4|nr:ABC transporter permease [Arthrobacter sp. SLBN-100]TQJ68418.1 monosaccharide ABC transporter membrane protein (CUT2 family) [Arthrobacter sp. SLBN-100]
MTVSTNKDPKQKPNLPSSGSVSGTGVTAVQRNAWPLQNFNLANAMRSWLGTTLVIVALVIMFSAMQPRFMTVLNWQNIAIQMSVLLVIAVAGTLPIVMGSIDLSVASVATLSGVILAMAMQSAGPSAAVAVPLALLVGAACGLLNGILFAVLRVPSFLATLGTFFALDGLASFLVGGVPIPISITSSASQVLDGRLGALPVLFLWALLVLAIAVVLCRYTRFGRHLFAVGGSEPAAVVAGINVRLVKVVAFTLAGLLAGFSGILLSVHALSGSPSQSASLLLPSIGAVVIGGTALSGGAGGPHRTFLGVLLLTILINGMQLLSVDPHLQLVIQGAVVVLAVIMSRQKVSPMTPIK